MSTSNSNSTLSKIPTAQLGGGVRKKNGHKENCGCPICKNMKHDKKKGGYTDVMEERGSSTQVAGGKKKNGHKAACKCPICKNMKKGGKRGGDIEEGEPSTVDDDFVDLEQGPSPAPVNEEEFVDLEEGPTPSPVSDETPSPVGDEKVGGSRRRKRRSSRKGVKGRKTRKNRRSRRSRR